MSTSPPPLHPSGVDTTLYHQLYAFKYITVITLGVFTWELITTFPTERKLYKKEFKPTLILLSLSRYFTLVCLILDVTFNLVIGATMEFCHHTRWILPLLASLIQVVAIPLLLLRTYAIWGKNNMIGAYLFLLWLGTLVIGIYTCTTYQGVPYSVFIGLDVLDGCAADPTNNWGTAPFIVNLITDSSILLLTLGRLLSVGMVSPVGQTKGGLTRVLVRDGILYYVVVVVINVINIVFFLAPGLPPLARPLIATPATIAPAIMVGRLYINLQHVFLAPATTVMTTEAALTVRHTGQRSATLGQWNRDPDIYSGTEITVAQEVDVKPDPLSSAGHVYPPQPQQPRAYAGENDNPKGESLESV